MSLLIRLFSPGLAIISFLLMVYLFYRSEIFWLGEKRNYYIEYFVFSIFLFFLSIVSFYFNKNIKQYLIIIFISSSFTFYFFEAYLIYKDNFKKFRIYETQNKVEYDKRSKLDIYNDLNKQDDYVVSIAGKYYNAILEKENFFPLSGISNSNTIHCNENGFFSIYRSDRFGFNNPNIEWEKNEIEYLIVGDSFVHGNCVNRPNDISSVLRNVSNRGVINLGYEHHRGPLMQYASLKEYLNPNVKKVVWVYYEGNDLYDLKSELNNKVLINYLNDPNFSQNLKLKQNKIDKIARKIINEKLFKTKNESLFFKFVKLYYTRSLIKFTTKPYKELFENETQFTKILKLTKDLVEKNNSKLFFVYLPEYNRYITKYDNTNYMKIKKIISELEIPFIDIHKEVFKKEKNPLNLFPFGMKGHFNVKGYKKTAEFIYNHTNDKLE